MSKFLYEIGQTLRVNAKARRAQETLHGEVVAREIIREGKPDQYNVYELKGCADASEHECNAVAGKWPEDVLGFLEDGHADRS